MARKRKRSKKKVTVQQVVVQPTRRRNRRRRRRTAEPGQAGMARASRTSNFASDSAVESGRDFVGSVSLPVALDASNFLLLEQAITPEALSNTRVSYMARCWEKYRYTQCELEFVPAASSAVGGQLLAYFEMDADADAPDTVEDAARIGAAHQGAVVFNVYTPTVIKMPSRLGIRDFFTGRSTEKRLGVQAVARVCALAGASGPGVTTTQPVGSFYLRWSVRFEGRQLEPETYTNSADAAALLGLCEGSGATAGLGAQGEDISSDYLLYGVPLTSRLRTTSRFSDVRYGVIDGTITRVRRTDIRAPIGSDNRVISSDGLYWIVLQAHEGWWYECSVTGLTNLTHLATQEPKAVEALDQHLVPAGNQARVESLVRDFAALRASLRAAGISLDDVPAVRAPRRDRVPSTDDEDLSDLPYAARG